MTGSDEPRAELDPRVGRPCDETWRTEAWRAQRLAMPDGDVTLSCSAPPGTGGLGRHVEEIAAALQRAESRTTCICGPERERVRAPSPATWARLEAPRLLGGLGALKVPLTPGIRARAFMAEFDAYAAARMPAGEHLIAFNGQAREQFVAARAAGYRSLGLVSANSHVHRLARQHALARRRYPLERSWATHLIARNLEEYSRAEHIYVASSYVRESFLREGFSEAKLVGFPLTPDPRYAPRQLTPTSGRFELVYVGSLSVHKGVPLLIDAVRRLRHGDLRLTLVGGWASRGVRRFIQRACAADSRITARPGDPLPQLLGANLCVHPAYEDGFAYAPAEALACGVPVLVSEDTGMKDLIDRPSAGRVLATGDLDALTEAIDAAYRGEILGG